MILLKSTYLAETNDYLSPVAGISFKNSDLNIMTRTKDYFVNGMHAYHKKNPNDLENTILKMAAEQLLEQQKVNDNGIRVCGNINRSIATQGDIEKARIMELELRALLALLKEDPRDAEKYFRLATDLESKTSYAYGPPQIAKPSFELYGDWLLSVNRPGDALQQYEQSIKLAPGRKLALEGKQNAMKLQAAL